MILTGILALERISRSDIDFCLRDHDRVTKARGPKRMAPLLAGWIEQGLLAETTGRYLVTEREVHPSRPIQSSYLQSAQEPSRQGLLHGWARGSDTPYWSQTEAAPLAEGDPLPDDLGYPYMEAGERYRQRIETKSWISRVDFARFVLERLPGTWEIWGATEVMFQQAAEPPPQQSGMGAEPIGGNQHDPELQLLAEGIAHEFYTERGKWPTQEQVAKRMMEDDRLPPSKSGKTRSMTYIVKLIRNTWNPKRQTSKKV